MKKNIDLDVMHIKEFADDKEIIQMINSELYQKRVRNKQIANSICSKVATRAFFSSIYDVLISTFDSNIISTCYKWMLVYFKNIKKAIEVN